MGNDLVRFIDLVIGRPVIVSGLSSGGVLSAWLSAYAKPGQVLAAHYEDPPLFASQVNPATGQGIRQAIGADVQALEQLPRSTSGHRRLGRHARRGARRPPFLAARRSSRSPDEPPQNLKEYDPEWGAAFWSGHRRRVV